MAVQTLKIIATSLAFSGGILALIKSLTDFFPGLFMGKMNYNMVPHPIVKMPFEWVISSFMLSVAVIIIALFAYKHHYTTKTFSLLIVLSIVMIVVFNLSLMVSGLFVLAGGLLGIIAVMIQGADKPNGKAL